MIGTRSGSNVLKKDFIGGFSNASVAHFSTTAKVIWTTPGRKVGTVRGFINPENQDDGLHTIDSIL